MGVLAPGSAHARPSAQPPINVSENFLVHVSAESPSKISQKKEILTPKTIWRPPLASGSETSDMTSEGLGEMFEGDSADTCAGKFPLTLMGG